MKFLLDSCISFFAVKELRNSGFEVLWIPENGEDPGDEVILERAFRENYVLDTVDKDFGELVFFKKKSTPTIIRLVNFPAKKQGKILLRLIDKYKKELKIFQLLLFINIELGYDL